MTTTPEQLLDLPIAEGTLRSYLLGLLHTLWAEGSDFSSKRPLGDTDWQWIVYTAMVNAGHVEGQVDSDGYLMGADTDTADRLIAGAITALH